jgi:hypothetical protein
MARTTKAVAARFERAIAEGRPLGPKGRAYAAHKAAWETRWARDLNAGRRLGDKGRQWVARLSDREPGRGDPIKRKARWQFYEEPIDELTGNTRKKRKK